MTATRFLLAVSTVLALAIVTAAHREVPVTAALRDPGSPSSGADQVDLAVTVYNSNLALVRDVREFAIRPGESDLSFVDIAATVNPATVHFRSR